MPTGHMLQMVNGESWLIINMNVGHMLLRWPTVLLKPDATWHTINGLMQAKGGIQASIPVMAMRQETMHRKQCA